MSPLRVRALLLTAALAGLTSAGPATGSELRAGFGVAPLPVPANGVLAGYGGLHDRRAREVLDPPEARALLLERDGLRIAVIAMDLLIARPRLHAGVLAAVPHLDLDALLLVATHTHSGPGGYISGRVAGRLTGGSFQRGTREALVRSARDALQRAADELAPARVDGATAKLDLARNRRDHAGPHETALPVLRFAFADGRPPILLFAYGAHPVVLSPRSHAYSADYVGAARVALETHGWRALFLPGPLGDQEPASALGDLWPREVEKQKAQVLEVGTRLAEAVARQVRALPSARLDRRAGPTLRLRTHWIEPPPARIRRFCTIWWLSPFVRGSLRGFLSKRAPIQIIELGTARIVALPAEPTSALGEALRGRLDAHGPLFVVAHANDWLGYVVEAERYRRGGYEACLSFYGPDFGATLVHEAAVAAGGMR